MGLFTSKSSPEQEPAKVELSAGERLKLIRSRVLVRVWKSKWDGGHFVGHVSVEVLGASVGDSCRGFRAQDTYISFWPYLVW